MNDRVAAIILAAGTSSRMGTNKLLLPIDGVPMLNHAIDAALYSQACRVLVVAGHESDAVVRLCSEYTTEVVHNTEYTSGMASSVRTGIAALPADISATLVMLGDMPYVTTAQIDRLIDAHRAAPAAICVPYYRGRRGHPVLWPRRFFDELQKLTGDTDGELLLAHLRGQVLHVEFDNPAIVLDCDTPESLPGPAQVTAQGVRAAGPLQSKRY